MEAIYEFIEADASKRAWFNVLAETIHSLERFPERGAVRNFASCFLGRSQGPIELFTPWINAAIL
jgi:hypothetical protein